MGRRPLHEVRDNQEIAREPHRLDDADLQFEAVPISLLGRGQGQGLQLDLQPLARLVRQFLRLGTAGGGGKSRQDGIALMHHEGAAAGDIQGVVAGLGQIGKQPPHLIGRLEPVLGRDAPAVILADEAARLDAQQGVVRLVLVGAGEIDVVGGDQRCIVGVGPRHQSRLGRGLGRQAVPLQLDIEAVAESGLHGGQRRLPLRRAPGGEQGIDRAVHPAGQQDQALGVGQHLVPGHLRVGPGLHLQIGGRRQHRQIAVPDFVLGQQHHGGYARPALGRPSPMPHTGRAQPTMG